MITAKSRAQLFNTIKVNCKTWGIPIVSVQIGDISGAYSGYDKELTVIEYSMHELAHLLALGMDLKTVPKNTGKFIDDKLSKMPIKTADILEVDTASITYNAGLKMGLWTDCEAIRESSYRNLQRQNRGQYEVDFHYAVLDTRNIDKGIQLQKFLRRVCRNA